MKSKWTRTAILAGTAMLFAVVGCNQIQNQNPSTGVPADLEQADENKADEVTAYTEVESGEALYSTGLKKMICKLLKNKEGWPGDFFDTCWENFTFTLETYKQSTAVSYLDDCEPVTLEMTVAVNDEAGDNAWKLRLIRHFNNEYKLRWGMNVLESSSSQVDEYIQEIADEVGEYGTFDDAPVGSWTYVEYDEIPAHIRTVAEARRDAINEESQLYNPNDDYDMAEIDGDHVTLFDDDGDTIGYVVSIYYYIDDPLFDGGGTRLYYNLDGRLVVEVDWWG